MKTNKNKQETDFSEFPSIEFPPLEFPSIELCNDTETAALNLFRQLNPKEQRQILSAIETMIHG